MIVLVTKWIRFIRFLIFGLAIINYLGKSLSGRFLPSPQDDEEKGVDEEERVANEVTSALCLLFEIRARDRRWQQRGSMGPCLEQEMRSAPNDSVDRFVVSRSTLERLSEKSRHSESRSKEKWVHKYHGCVGYCQDKARSESQRPETLVALVIRQKRCYIGNRSLPVGEIRSK